MRTIADCTMSSMKSSLVPGSRDKPARTPLSMKKRNSRSAASGSGLSGARHLGHSKSATFMRNRDAPFPPAADPAAGGKGELVRHSIGKGSAQSLSFLL